MFSNRILFTNRDRSTNENMSSKGNVDKDETGSSGNEYSRWECCHLFYRIQSTGGGSVFTFSMWAMFFYFFYSIRILKSETGWNVNEIYLGNIQLFLISRELVQLPFFNLTTHQRGPYCVCMNRHSPLWKLSRKKDAIESFCIFFWQRNSQYEDLVDCFVKYWTETKVRSIC